MAVILIMGILYQKQSSDKFKLEQKITALENQYRTLNLANKNTSTAAGQPSTHKGQTSSQTPAISKEEICQMFAGNYNNPSFSELCHLPFSDEINKVQSQSNQLYQLIQKNIGAVQEQLAILQTKANNKDTKVDLSKIEYNSKPDPNAPKPPENSNGGGAEIKKDQHETICVQNWGEASCEKGLVVCKNGVKTYFRPGKSPSGLPKIHYICIK